MKNTEGTEERIEALHGGDVYRNNVSLDFSVNLNPMEIPARISAECFGALSELRQYPDPFTYDLRKAVSAMDGVSMGDVICGNGASEIIMAAVHAVRPAKALLTVPCYSGYRTALGAAGADIIEHRLREADGFGLTESLFDDLTDDIEMLFLGNPNNPSGRLINVDLLDSIKTFCRKRDICLIIDECFLPLTLRGAEVPEDNDTAVHIRAFTKTFSIPSLRLGYAICRDREFLRRIERQLPEWNVSLIAQRAGIAAAKEASGASLFMQRSVELVERERGYLTEELGRLGITTYPSDTNYLLLKSSPGLYEMLLQKGIMIRRCSNFSGLDETYFRIAVRKHDDNRLLIDTLKGILQND